METSTRVGAGQLPENCTLTDMSAITSFQWFFGRERTRMKGYLVSALAALAFSIWPLGVCFATALPPPLSPAKARHHIGEVALVEGKVAQVQISRSGDIFLHFGRDYPNATFTAVIPAAARQDFAKGTPLAGLTKAYRMVRGIGSDPRKLKGETVHVSGRIELYNGRPRMILRHPGDFSKRSGIPPVPTESVEYRLLESGKVEVTVTRSGSTRR
jgi:hypothetical protein